MSKRMIEIYPLNVDSVITVNNANTNVVCENGNTYVITEASGDAYNITIPKTTKRCFIMADLQYEDDIFNIDFGKDRVIKYFYNMGSIGDSKMIIDDSFTIDVSADYWVQIGVLVENDVVEITFSSIAE